MHQPLLHFEEKKTNKYFRVPPPPTKLSKGWWIQEYFKITQYNRSKTAMEHKRWHFEKCFRFWPYNKSQWYPVSFWKNAFFKISSVVFHRQKKGIQVQSVIRDRIFIFCVNHPFNFCSKCMRREPFPLQLLYSYDGWNECTQNILTKRQYISLPSDWKQASGANK